jgi:hypothetical protein
LAYSKAEAAEAEAGVPAIHNVTPSGFILAGLDLEEQQYVAPYLINRVW